jgi:hypothetical protein
VSSAAALAVLVAVMLVGFVVTAYLVSRRRAEQTRPGEPDRVTGDVVTGLMAELRKSQAETEYWKSAAQRLQREVDGR